MNRHKKILILADGFSTPSYLPRLRAICDYLYGQGWEMTVVVEHIAQLPFEHKYAIDEVRIYTGSRWDWMVKNVWSLMTDWKNRTMSRYVERQYGHKQYDAVFCTTFHTFPLLAAVEFGKRHHIPVTLDLRDIVEQAPGNAKNYVRHNQGIAKLFIGLFHHINIHRRNHWLRLADHVTTVSPWHVQMLKQFNEHVYLIYNGYDANRYYWEERKNEEFVLSYVGKIFGEPLQEPSLLWEVLREIKDRITYKVIIHTDPLGQELAQQWVKQYGLSDRVEISGYIRIEEAIELYHQSSIFLIFSNKASDKTVHGMMTTKFFEALGVEKPVLCIRSDEECLAEIIHATKAGLAVRDKEELVHFIEEKYREWQTNGYTRQMMKDKEQFSRLNEAKELEKVLL